MKKFLSILAAAALIAVSCDPVTPEAKIFNINVNLTKGDAAYEAADITISLRNLNNNVSYKASTNDSGMASFTVPSGIYEGVASFRKEEDENLIIYNGVNSNITVLPGGTTSFTISLSEYESRHNQIIVKELYTGGCVGSDGKPFQYDAYVILYNNSDTPADASDICFGFTMPLNSNGVSDWLVDGELSYSGKYIPAGYGIWWFDTDIIIQPYSQIIVAIKGAIDNTVTHPNSIDLSKADYAMYDPESGYNHPKNYPAPAATIPATNYLKAYAYGIGNGWALSIGSSAFFIYNMENAKAFAQTEANLDYTMKTSSILGPCVKIPHESIVDAVEVFAIGNEDKNAKRFPASLDAGYIYYTTGEGYSAYRNVDKEATEAIEGNKEKLVYGYSLGTESIDQTTDPSGIDAEASVANGAVIVYKDTNNSTNDFHLRSKASLKK